MNLRNLVLVGVLLAGPAQAHDWYPIRCCSGLDCYPIGLGEREPAPVATPGGWKLSDGTVVPFEDARISPDSKFHVCRRGGLTTGEVIVPSDEPPCLWVPAQGA